jgi:N-acetylglutamate synthase-like GNAT family acetyltransferase
MKEAESPGQPRFRGGLQIRKACEADHAPILELLGALELGYTAMDLSCFWVAESASEVVATAELQNLRTCSLLSCVGVREDLQGIGIGQALVERVVLETPLPVYLYTLIPGFFRKVGFRDAHILPADLPPRSIYGCVGCDSSICLCMVRTREGS